MAEAAASVAAWEDDPGSGGGLKPITRPVPALEQPPLPLHFAGPAVEPGMYDPGTPQFRYWAAAEALRRAADFWAPLLPPGASWQPGGALQVLLDEGVDLNAYYDRNALNFFHATVDGTTYYSGESPDVVCHEEGHAILDAIRPQLWDAQSAEPAALHESFGDMSAILSALQLQSFREAVLAEVDGRLERSSRLSRLAEQLGAAIRRVAPDAAEPDCLRNAVNSFFYQDPVTLPPSAPASALASEPHSFSRVFTGAFFEALAAMLVVLGDPSQDRLHQVSVDLGRLLVDAALAAPVVPDYYAQVAAHLVEADTARFAGRYGSVIKGAFVHHGILSLDAATQPASVPGGALDSAGGPPPALPVVALAGAPFGLGARTLLVTSPGEAKRLDATSAALDAGPSTPPAHELATRAFVEDLFQRGQVSTGSFTDAATTVRRPSVLPTHEVITDPGSNALLLVRRRFA
ncbi:MAG: hypothetical protein JO023_29580 [Chloroflexi bacterium]|nr:hypothetical protein [Chloroflexota bacterium]